MPSTFRLRLSGALICVLLALVLLPSMAGAVVVTDMQGNIAEPFQTWAERVEKKGLPTASVMSVDVNGCTWAPKARGCAVLGTTRIYLCPWSCETWDLKRQTFWHEMGHVYVEVAQQKVTKAFSKILRDKREWFAEPNSLSEQFAEAYKLCAANPGRIPSNVSYGNGYNPSDKTHRQVCRMLQRQKGKPLRQLPYDPLAPVPKTTPADTFGGKTAP